MNIRKCLLNRKRLREEAAMTYLKYRWPGKCLEWLRGNTAERFLRLDYVILPKPSLERLRVFAQVCTAGILADVPPFKSGRPVKHKQSARCNPVQRILYYYCTVVSVCLFVLFAVLRYDFHL
jgi:hypothetical protein